jgi:hypothetical protein
MVSCHSHHAHTPLRRTLRLINLSMNHSTWDPCSHSASQEIALNMDQVIMVNEYKY